MTKTTLATTQRATARWYVIDASQHVLGRMAAKVALVLQGKNKPTWTPHADTGDFVVVINAADVRVTGRKAEAKVYRRHTGYPGGMRETPYADMKVRHPDAMVREAVRRMLPKTTLGRHMLSKLKIYPGKDHPHHAQKPEPLSLATKA
ncbi:MAG: 50S ribosomal protein L13 [Planctomycetia bacterium]